MKHIKNYNLFNEGINDRIDNPYDRDDMTPSKQESIGIRKKALQDLIEDYQKEGKDLEFLVKGYVVNKGGPKGLDTRSVVYGTFPTEDDNVLFVLSDSVGGGVLWFRYNRYDVHVDEKRGDKREGVKLYKRMQDIKK